ncbi:hypothetical protein EJ04DRAFT_581496 [Polyplosphaeria fusca]|uniref:Alcohol acetyltransferase n=1 Tax=Polyplosphaeria fusca TaxID=682080 RepID=A0A9P4QNW4_9PLEO|nr:hypothetical protein EJ04DRAFT_581496 [Polyplosphaeria fusca]
MVETSALEGLRPCGHIEKYSTSRHHLKIYNNVACAASYSRPASSTSLQAIIFEALRAVIKTHPILSAIPLDEDKPETYFARLPSINLDTCVTFVERKASIPSHNESDQELDALIQAQHNLAFKDSIGTKPFWRLVVLHPTSSTTNFTLIWVFHHALADGTAGLIFHRTFVSALRSLPPALPEESNPLVTPPSTPLIPPLEDLHPLPLSFWFILKTLWGSWFPSRPASLWTGSSIPSPPAQSSNLRTLILSASTTEKLLALSRANKTSLTATLETLVASAVFTLLDQKHTTLRVDGPISLRRFLTLKDQGQGIEDALGTFTGQYFHTHTRASEAGDAISWPEARAVRSSITTELAKNGKDSTVGLLRWVSDLQKFFEEKVGQPRGGTFELSNVGVFEARGGGNKGENEESWRIGRVVFSQSMGTTGPAFSCSVVTGADGCCVLAFNWLEEGPGELDVEKVMQEVRKRIDAFAGTAQE